ncbi:MAG: hypothetical protein ABIK68_05640 [bacterium]|nr:hypothetical protein [bacterium]
MVIRNQYVVLPILMILFWLPAVGAETLKTRYATLTYTNQDHLEGFNDNLRVGKQLYYMVKKRKPRTLEDEVKNKIDVIVEEVETVLEFFPDNLRFEIQLFETTAEVKQAYQKLFRREGVYVAFFNPRNNTVYIGVEDTSLKIFAHELAHVVIENYYKVPTPPKIHEFLARMATSQIVR